MTLYLRHQPDDHLDLSIVWISNPACLTWELKPWHRFRLRTLIPLDSLRFKNPNSPWLSQIKDPNPSGEQALSWFNFLSLEIEEAAQCALYYFGCHAGEIYCWNLLLAMILQTLGRDRRLCTSLKPLDHNSFLERRRLTTAKRWSQCIEANRKSTTNLRSGLWLRETKGRLLKPCRCIICCKFWIGSRIVGDERQTVEADFRINCHKSWMESSNSKDER